MSEQKSSLEEHKWNPSYYTGRNRLRRAYPEVSRRRADTLWGTAPYSCTHSEPYWLAELLLVDTEPFSNKKRAVLWVCWIEMTLSWSCLCPYPSVMYRKPSVGGKNKAKQRPAMMGMIAKKRSHARPSPWVRSQGPQSSYDPCFFLRFWKLPSVCPGNVLTSASFYVFPVTCNQECWKYWAVEKD